MTLILGPILIPFIVDSDLIWLDRIASMLLYFSKFFFTNYMQPRAEPGFLELQPEFK